MNEVKSININQVNQLTDVEVIDIRENEELISGVISGSKHIPMMGLVMNPDLFLDKSKTYAIYCSAGGRSLQVCTMLGQAGYKMINLDGGYNSYQGE